MRLVTTLTFTLLLALPLLGAPEAHAQARAASDFWTDVAESAALARPADAAPLPTAYRTLRLNRDAMAQRLADAPLETVPGNLRGAVEVPLPMPDGSYEWFRVIESPIMAPGLQARYPQIRTYVGQGIDTPAATVRFSVTPHGFAAMALRPSGTVFVDSYAPGDTEHYLAYHRADAVPHPELQNLAPDLVLDELGEGHGAEVQGAEVDNGEQLRIYRLAVATTGEYSAVHGGTVDGALAAIVKAMNRVNGIYEREVAVRMILIEENDQIIYTDAATDPYTNNNGFTMLGENQANLDAVIGSDNYDIGHVFSTGGGGVAGLGVVCRVGQKGRGVTGLPNPVGDRFYVDYVAHEMGHQFRGNHSFNGAAGSCSGGNRNAGTAYEPGSGSTIMAYAGICSAHNIQGFSDDYFHNISLTEITAFINNPSTGGSCGEIVETENQIPEVSAETGFDIPIGTPFILEGSATDDTPEALTYVWEEMDLGPAGPPAGVSGYNNTPPFFRSFLPTTEPVRYFPQMDRLLQGFPPVRGEGLPIDSRLMRFRMTVRDNTAGAGSISDVQISINTDETVGPFALTFANEEDLEFEGGSEQVVTWDVAGTGLFDDEGIEDEDDVDVEFVTILYSDNGGESFDHVLALATPNDGAEAVVLPNVETDAGRLMIRAVDNIFFDINDEAFSVVESTVANEAQPQATGFALSAVYPNPLGAGSASRGTLNLSVEQAQQVEVVLYDALGRRVRVLFSGPLASGQNRQVTLDTAGLAGGVYFVRATGETFSDVRQVTLAR